MLPGFQRPKGSLESSRNDGPKRTRLGWVVRPSQEDGLGGSEHHETSGMKDRNKPLCRQFPAQGMWAPLNRAERGREPGRAFNVWQDNGAGLYPISCWDGGRLSLVLSTQKGDLVPLYNPHTNPRFQRPRLIKTQNQC